MSFRNSSGNISPPSSGNDKDTNELRDTLRRNIDEINKLQTEIQQNPSLASDYEERLNSLNNAVNNLRSLIGETSVSPSSVLDRSRNK
jgi:uncharacterized protein YlxW (UPF0749 family)